MIVVKIEMWPKGYESRKRLLHTIKIRNDATGGPTAGNYIASVTKRGSDAIYATVPVTGFPRKRLGAYDLLYRVLQRVVGSRNPQNQEGQ